jgi:hypothetical protein
MDSDLLQHGEDFSAPAPAQVVGEETAIANDYAKSDMVAHDLKLSVLLAGDGTRARCRTQHHFAEKNHLFPAVRLVPGERQIGGDRPAD